MLLRGGPFEGRRSVLVKFISTILILNLFAKEFLREAEAKFCYSCAGTCHNQPCNCQMGSCEADFCFIEKRPTEFAGQFRITKGCVKRPARTRVGCDYDHYADHIQCVCSGDFCNDVILLRPILRRNITCRECPERQPDCGKTCQGQWCHEKVSTGGSGCGFGPPALPYFYNGPELLYHRSKICVTISRGNGIPHKYCICNTQLCNDYYSRSNALTPYLSGTTGGAVSGGHKSRSLVTYYRDSAYKQQFYECVNCDLTAEAETLTSNCKQNKCVGHFCVYATQRVFVSSARASSNSNGNAQAIIHEKQGCINVTDSSQIQLGCTHKWMNNEEEELYCACRGDQCNKDLASVSVGSSPSNPQPPLAYPLMLILILSATLAFKQNIL